jgi:hypothetical protein
MRQRGALALGLLAAVSAVLSLPPSSFASTDFLERPRVEVGDSDGDGRPEASASGVAGGPCACRCPVLGSTAGATAAGQALSADARSALVVCGTRLAVGVDPDDPDALRAPRADSRMQFNPGGLGRGAPAG